MKKPKTDKLDDAYARGLALFEEIDPQPPNGISREVFLDLVLQRLMFRERMRPMADIEREVAIRAIISTFIVEAPASPVEGMLLGQMLTNHEIIVHCQARSLDGSQPQIQREKDQAQAIKAMGVFLKQMEVRSRLAMRREEGAKAEKCSRIAKAIEEGNRRLETDMATRQDDSAKRRSLASGVYRDHRSTGAVLQAMERKSDQATG